jgi:hypothetical protein
LCAKNSSQKNLVVHKQKTTTFSSTKACSKQLIGVVNKSVYKKAWMRRKKVDRVATPQPPYNTTMSHTIATTIVSYYKTTTRLLHVVDVDNTLRTKKPLMFRQKTRITCAF